MGHLGNSAKNENIMTQEQILFPSEMEAKFNARNKPQPKKCQHKRKKNSSHKQKLKSQLNTKNNRRWSF
jgi:hypothetical protein